MKKKYIIKITNCKGKPDIWYAKQIGREYEAELNVKPGSTVVVFSVTMSQFVYPIDCIVVSEKLEEKYIG